MTAVFVEQPCLHWVCKNVKCYMPWVMSNVSCVMSKVIGTDPPFANFPTLHINLVCKDQTKPNLLSFTSHLSQDACHLSGRCLSLTNTSYLTIWPSYLCWLMDTKNWRQNVSCVMCQLSVVACHVSPLTCYLLRLSLANTVYLTSWSSDMCWPMEGHI